MKCTQSLPTVSVPSTRTRHRLRSRDWPRPPRRDPHIRIIAQLTQLSGPDVSVIASSSRPWASATFIGAQHRVMMQFSGEHAHSNSARFAELLPDAEFAVAGHIVVDACIDEWRHGTDEGTEISALPAPQSAGAIVARVTVLTVEDW